MSITTDIPNGRAAAAFLAAGIGSFVFGALSLAGDASPAINKALAFYVPSGALSGVSTVAVVVWLVTWFVLATLWRRKQVALKTINLTAFGLLAGGFLLTFPPFMDLLQGK